MTENANLKTQSNDSSFASLWDELQWRGLVHVSTDAEALQAALDGPPITYYCGFDPTAPSLHIGNLMLIITLRRLQLAIDKTPDAQVVGQASSGEAALELICRGGVDVVLVDDVLVEVVPHEKDGESR